MKHFPFFSVLFSVLLIFTAFGFSEAGDWSATADDPDSEEIVDSVPMEKVVPHEFDDDVRNLPYFPLAGTGKPQRPYRPLLKPPFQPKQGSGGYEPLIHSPYVPALSMPSPALQFAGMSMTDTCMGGQCGAGYPSDINGEVGPNHYIEAVNSAYAIYNKSGTKLASFTEDALWSTSASTTPCKGNAGGDPIVVYDPLADRWILSHFAFAVDGSGNPISPFYQCIAASKTSDPVHGGWWLYDLRMDPGGTGLPPVNVLNDYPKFGIWPDCLYMSANEFTMPAGSYAGVAFAAFSRSDLYSGQPLTWTLGYLNAASNIFTMIPSNMQGASPSSLPPAGTPNYYVSESQTAYAFEVRKFSTSGDCGSGTLSSAVNVFQTSYSFPADVPQLGSGTLLDVLTDRLMQKVRYRRIGSSESLWVVHTVRSATTAAASPQWAQIDVTGATIATTPLQQQIYDNGADGLYRWMGSIASDKDGNMAIGYSVSSNGMYPSIRYAGRLSTDLANTLGQGEATLIAGGGPQNFLCGGAACNRWGDYSAISVDPSDDCTFWYTNQYYDSIVNGSTNKNWQTRIGAFRFSTCDPGGLVKKGSDNALFAGIGAGYAFLSGTDTLFIQSITFYESPVLSQNIAVTLAGGYNSSFSAHTGMSAIHGSLSINAGSAVLDNISLQ